MFKGLKLNQLTLNSKLTLLNDNIIYNIIGSFDSEAHENALYFFGGGSVYNNKLYDLSDGMALYFGPPAGSNTADVLVYNNIVWNYAANIPLTVDGDGLGFTGTIRIFNNTLEGAASGTGVAIRIQPRGETFDEVVIENNHMISDDEDGLTIEDYVTVLTTNNNLVQTAAEATAEGYVEGNEFAPTFGGSTIEAGMSQSAYFTVDILGVSRPQSSIWDIGAYEFVSGGEAGGGPFASDLVMVLTQFLMIPIIQYLLGLWGFAAFVGMMKVINKYL